MRKVATSQGSVSTSEMVVLRSALLLSLLFSGSFAINCARNGDNTYNCNVNSVACVRKGAEAGCVKTCPPNTQKTRCESVDETALCCCSTENCNELKKTSIDASKLTFIIVGTIVGGVAIAIIGIIIGLICYFRFKKSKIVDSEKQEEKAPPPRRSTTAKLEEESQAETQYQEHEDLTDTKIQPTLAIEDKEELINSLTNPPAIPTFDEFSSPPKLVKIMTYGTTDAITVEEEFVKSPHPPDSEDDVGFCRFMLAELINNGPRQFAFELQSLKRVLKAGHRVFAGEPSLVTISVPCTIYGDIHGQYSDLHRWLNVNGWPSKRRSVFLGDFVDRGSHGVEVVALMCCLKVVFPDRIFICRGNHEEEILNKAYSFYNEVKKRFDDEASDNIYGYFKKVFNYLPLAAIVGKKILGMHGGISPKLKSLDDIMKIKRPIQDFVPGTLACDLVWSDPDLEKKNTKFRPNFDREPIRGIGQLYSAEAVKEACERLDIDLIVRGHQAPLHGYARWANGHLVTIFSAPGYKGENENDTNMGACMDANEDGSIILKQIKVTENFRKNRIKDVQSRDSE